MLHDSPTSFKIQIENPQLGKQEEISPPNTTRDIEAIKEKLYMLLVNTILPKLMIIPNNIAKTKKKNINI